MRRVAEEDAGRIGERGGDAAVENAHLAERLDLPRIERMLRLFGADEVAHQQRDAVVFGTDAVRQRRGVIAEMPSRFMPVSTCSAAPPRHCIGVAEDVPFRQFDHAADHRPRARSA